ncbi:MAG: hypothetical protein PVJ60_02195 [Phycisphaerales bacterium]
MKKGKKYIVCPGWIISKNDGDHHYITADMLIRLYGVDRRECIIADEGHFARAHDLDHLPRLWPLYDGNYREYLIEITSEMAGRDR